MTRTRFVPLIGSLWLAAGFIAVRVFWRLVTDGLDWGSLAQAARAALPFAALILACGLLSSLVNVRALLLRAPRLRLGGSIITALVIGLASVSELAGAARAARRAGLLRGSRSRFALAVPLLEHAIERTTALAAALELRGFGSRLSAQPNTEGIRLDALELHYGERRVLGPLSLNIEPGVTVLTGPTGGGKTSLLEAISGVAEQLNGARRSGELTAYGVDRTALVRDTAGFIGVVPQQVRLSFVGETASEELAFTAALLGTTPPAAGTTRITELSAGEAVAVALESALLGSPRVLLLDEPFADLDRAHRQQLLSRLSELAAAGGIIVVAEHHTAELDELSPRWLSVVGGQVTDGRWTAPPLEITRTAAIGGDDVTVKISAATMSYRGAPRSLNFAAELEAGTLVALTGPNGSGKSSLLAALAEPAAGTVHVRGEEVSGLQPDLIALVPENARELFLRETLGEELRLADRIAGVQAGLTELSLRSLLRSTDLDALWEQHPRDLSAGTQRALAIAIQLSHKPGLLLIDEPTRGLDPGARADMAEVLRCVAETGTAVVFATHDAEFAAALTSVHWQMDAGSLRFDSEPAALRSTSGNSVVEQRAERAKSKRTPPIPSPKMVER